MRSLENANQKHHLPVLHFADAHLDFRDLAPTDVPAGFLKLPRQIRLRPAAIVPDPSYLPPDNILVIHAAGKDSKIAPLAPLEAK